MKKIILLMIYLMGIFSSPACTIFVLTDGNEVLFFNNEDFTNPNNRIWFVAEGNDHYGCVYVGYDDGSAQGGMNTHGLAFDWYAGKPVKYRPESGLIPINDNSSERMLEQCKSVEDAIRFYQTYAEPGFAKASIIVADTTGTSVIIGAKDGKLFFDKSSESNVLGGQGKKTFQRLYDANTPVSLVSGRSILKQCVATGIGGTLYSNSYNLKTGDIHIYDFAKDDKLITLNLLDELKKGEHFYDLHQVSIELEKPLKPLQLNMQRLILFDYQPLESQEPQVSALVKNIFIDGAIGNLKATYFSDKLWKELNPIQEQLKSELAGLGELNSHDLIRKEIGNESTAYSYIMIFENARLLQQFTLDKNGKVSDLQTLSSVATDETLAKGGLRDNQSFETMRYNESAILVVGLVIAFFIVFITVRRNKWDGKRTYKR